MCSAAQRHPPAVPEPQEGEGTLPAGLTTGSVTGPSPQPGTRGTDPVCPGHRAEGGRQRERQLRCTRAPRVCAVGSSCMPRAHTRASRLGRAHASPSSVRWEDPAATPGSTATPVPGPRALSVMLPRRTPGLLGEAAGPRGQAGAWDERGACGGGGKSGALREQVGHGPGTREPSARAPDGRGRGALPVTPGLCQQQAPTRTHVSRHAVTTWGEARAGLQENRGPQRQRFRRTPWGAAGEDGREPLATPPEPGDPGPPPVTSSGRQVQRYATRGPPHLWGALSKHPHPSVTPRTHTRRAPSDGHCTKHPSRRQTVKAAENGSN